LTTINAGVPKSVMLEAALICRAVVPTCAQHGEITRITAEVSKPDEWFAASRPFHRIVIYAERRGADKFIDVSLKHLLAEGIRELMRAPYPTAPILSFRRTGPKRNGIGDAPRPHSIIHPRNPSTGPRRKYETAGGAPVQYIGKMDRSEPPPL
jgi:hypothetical protein